MKQSTENNKKIIAFLCFAGFIVTSSVAPFLYLVKAGGFDRVVIKDSPNNVGEEIFRNINIKAKAVAIYDTADKKFIYTKNGNAQLPLASITKVMSSISAIRIAERMDKEKPVEFAGNWWNLYDLMKFTLVSSSNSGITSIAEAMASVENKETEQVERIDFIDEMNQITKELDLKTTYFLNETGLDLNEELGGVYLSGGYGSAKDVTRMFAYATEKYPIVFGSTKYPEIKITSKNGEEKISKNTNLDTIKMTTLIASKTGTTDLAGGNLVISFDAGLSHPVIISVLGSTPEDRLKDVEVLAKATIDFLSKQ